MTAGLLLTLASASAHAADFYVAPDAKSTGNGTIDNPWTLSTAIAHPAAVKPGDTIYLRGGTYLTPDRRAVSMYLRGAPGQYITLRSKPGEHVRIDGGFYVQYGWVIIRDLEFASSRTQRTTTQKGSFPSDILQPSGIESMAPNVKVINNVIHDMSTGVASWKQASDNEFYGNLVYYNGWQAPDRPHGHGAYMQNTSGNKVLQDNIFFSGFELGLQLYGSANTFLNNFQLEGNIIFKSGELGGRSSRNILIGGDVVAANPVLRNNYTYFPTSNTTSGENNIGYWPNGAGCSNLTLENNYFVAGYTALALQKCSVTSLQGNTFYGDARNWTASSYPSNTYLGRTRPAGYKVFVRPNKYESGRANIAVFNWARQATVPVDLNGIGLQSGDAFEIRDAQNFYGASVYQGVFTGSPVDLPMTSTAVAQPIGDVPYKPTHSDMEFGAFIVLRLGGNAPAPPPPPPPPALTIGAASVSGSTTSSATLSGTTSNPASTLVEFGTTAALGAQAGANTALTAGHSVTLSNLAAGTTYYTRLVSVDAHTQTAELRTLVFTTATPPPPPPPPPAPTPTPTPTPAPTPTPTPTPNPSPLPVPATKYNAWYEAENGVRVSFPIVSDATLSGRKYIYAEKNETGYVTWNVYNSVAGTFTFWFRGLAKAADSASFYVSVDGGLEDICDLPVSASWQWVRLNGRGSTNGAPLTLNPRTFVLKAGWHKLTVRARQAGTALDGLLLTNDFTLVPTDAAFTTIR